jgi:tetratricopeptide (TPR) repeat protein
MNKKKLGRLLDTALIHHKAGEHTEAAKLYAQVCEAAPRLFDGWYLAGTLAVHDNRPADAVPLLKRALRIEPSSARCALFLGMAQADLGQFAEAEKPLQAALKKYPNHPEAWTNLGKCFTFLGRPTEAEECRQRANALQPPVDAPAASDVSLAAV